MSSIRTPQRRALEKLLGENSENTIAVDRGTFYLDEEQIFLLGVSEGIGTCSDLHGIYIGVFSSGNLLGNIQGPAHELCAGLALLRDPTDEEREEQFYSQSAHMLVEGLEIIEELTNCEHSIGTESNLCRHLILTGVKVVYVNTIT